METTEELVYKYVGGTVGVVVGYIVVEELVGFVPLYLCSASVQFWLNSAYRSIFHQPPPSHPSPFSLPPPSPFSRQHTLQHIPTPPKPTTPRSNSAKPPGSRLETNTRPSRRTEDTPIAVKGEVVEGHAACSAYYSAGDAAVATCGVGGASWGWGGCWCVFWFCEDGEEECEEWDGGGGEGWHFWGENECSVK